MLRRAYDQLITLSARPEAPWALGGVAFAESSFFPLPPDVMLVPMCLAEPERAWRYAFIATLASVAGGLFGYAIGALLYDSVGKWLITLYGYADKADAFRAAYAHYGHWIILIKGVTPIPYKLVTITSGFANYSLFWFTVLSLITRGVRFGLVAVLIQWKGAAARDFIEKRLELVTLVFGLVMIVGVVLAFYVF